MSQKTQILSFLSSNIGQLITPKIISETLGIPAASVRRALFNLRQEEKITKPIKKGKNRGKTKIRKRGIDIPPDKIYYRKIVKGTVYCQFLSYAKHSKESAYAVTYEDNETDRSFELLAEIYAEKPNCHPIDESFGYSDNLATSNITNKPVYPIIVVGSEL